MVDGAGRARHERIWRRLMVLLMLIGVALALRPLLPDQGPENWFPQSDKLLHLGFFALLWCLGVRSRLGPSWLLALSLVAYGVGIEVAQGLFTTTRSASALDVVSDSVGLLAGAVFTRWAGSRRQPEEHRG